MLALAILMMGSVFLPSPASAHQGDITAVASCQPNGSYLVTYNLTWSQVPEAAYGTRILTREDSDATIDSGWESQPGSYQWTDRGAITSEQGSIEWTDTLPGTTAGAGIWEYAWFDWTNGNTPNKLHDTRIEDLGGDCADTTTPTPVTVTVDFSDNACVDNAYTEPSMNAPEVEGTSQEITGTVAPGEMVTVVYTALDGFVIDGQSTFDHTFQPEALVRDRSTVRTDCDGVEKREWQVVTGYVWNGEEWVLGEPEVHNDTGWVLVRKLSVSDQKQLGCLDVAGEEVNNDTNNNNQQQQPIVEVAPTQATPQTVPTSVDAGLGDSIVAPAGPRWLMPMLGGLILLALAGFKRVKEAGDALSAR